MKEGSHTQKTKTKSETDLEWSPLPEQHTDSRWTVRGSTWGSPPCSRRTSFLKLFLSQYILGGCLDLDLIDHRSQSSKSFEFLSRTLSDPDCQSLFNPAKVTSRLPPYPPSGGGSIVQIILSRLFIPPWPLLGYHASFKAKSTLNGYVNLLNIP